nr:hypothetical protein [Tanacetum cinerariifolium]
MIKLEKSIGVSRSLLNDERALVLIEHLLEQLAELYSKHDPVRVVSLAGKTIQDAKMFDQLVNHRHLSQTLDVRFPPSDSGGSFLIIILSSSLQNGRISIGVQNSLRNAELNIERFSRIMLGIVGGGIGASTDVVIVAMVEGVIIGVGVSRDTIGEDVVVKIDSTPTSLIGFNILDTNDYIDELSCGPSGLTGVRVT